MSIQGPPPLNRDCGDHFTFLRPERRVHPVRARSHGPPGHDGERVDRSIESGSRVMREIGNADQGGGGRQGMTSGRSIARRGQLGRDQQRHDSTRLHELEGPFEERDGKIWTVAEPRPPSPPAVPIGETLPLLPRNLLGPEPGGFPTTRSNPPAAKMSGKWLW